MLTKEEKQALLSKTDFDVGRGFHSNMLEHFSKNFKKELDFVSDIVANQPDITYGELKNRCAPIEMSFANFNNAVSFLAMKELLPDTLSFWAVNKFHKKYNDPCKTHKTQ